MPIFEYRCASCGKRFEALQSRADEPHPSCPGCGAARVERQLSAFAVLGGPSAGHSAGVAPGPCGSPDCACRKH